MIKYGMIDDRMGMDQFMRKFTSFFQLIYCLIQGEFGIHFFLWSLSQYSRFVVMLWLPYTLGTGSAGSSNVICRWPSPFPRPRSTGTGSAVRVSMVVELH